MARRAFGHVLLLGIVLGIGCGSSADDAPDTQPETPDATPAPVVASVLDQRLLDRDWQLESLGAVGEEKPILRATKIALRFHDDGTLDGFSGCNTYRTTYRTGAAGEISVRALNRTADECTEGITRQEETYLDVLRRVESYEVHEDQLLLFYEGGGRDLVYRAAAPDGG